MAVNTDLGLCSGSMQLLVPSA